MDATIHSTQLMGQHVSLPTPLTPLQSPIPPRPRSQNITEDPKSDTDNSTPIKNVRDYQASFLIMCYIYRELWGSPDFFWLI